MGGSRGNEPESWLFVNVICVNFVYGAKKSFGIVPEKRLLFIHMDSTFGGSGGNSPTITLLLIPSDVSLVKSVNKSRGIMPWKLFWYSPTNSRFGGKRGKEPESLFLEMSRLVIAVISSKISKGRDPSSSVTFTASDVTLPFLSQTTRSQLASQQPQSQTESGVSQLLVKFHPLVLKEILAMAYRSFQRVSGLLASLGGNQTSLSTSHVMVLSLL